MASDECCYLDEVDDEKGLEPDEDDVSWSYRIAPPYPAPRPSPSRSASFCPKPAPLVLGQPMELEDRISSTEDSSASCARESTAGGETWSSSRTRATCAEAAAFPSVPASSFSSSRCRRLRLQYIVA